MRFMPIVEIVRLEESEQGTFGIMRINKQMFCCTLELPDKLNRPNMSSIPAQQYLCVKHQSPLFGVTFKVDNVPGRSHILFHAGNTDDDTEGCILLGQHFGKLKGDRAILNSGVTFKDFMNHFSDHHLFHLTIKEDF